VKGCTLAAACASWGARRLHMAPALTGRSGLGPDLGPASRSRPIVRVVKWKQSRRKVTGGSLPVVGGGLSWSQPQAEKDVVRALVIDLEERRALFEPVSMEDEAHLNESIKEIRRWLSTALKALVDDSEAYRLVRHLRTACNAYLSLAPDPTPGLAPRPHFQAALQALRESFRVTLAYIGREGDLPQATDLARKIPHEVRVQASIGEPLRGIESMPLETPESGREPRAPKEE
jgi:hypothetical protein